MVMARRGDGRRRCAGVLEMVVMIKERRNEEDGWLHRVNENGSSSITKKYSSMAIVTVSAEGKFSIA
ncbi:hypothetical protein E2C01_033462 [Portunus trituberculatus]|uniref:Uncharacterized protein n=1 Tax=Portunus trituberculatus TaxID=210409 RepID=A0A5B7EYR2_PORTR|nr:hypothetical protein [Portunus trituberculatus]